MSSGKVDLKVVLLGKEYGGKTSLVERYIHGKFNESAPYQAVRPSANYQTNAGLCMDGCERCVLRLVLIRLLARPLAPGE